jgi:predicted nuclease of predicted toxin-antitoxin system
MILADENIHGFIIKALRDAGFEVVAVIEQAKSIKDEQVIELALEMGYILLTEDKDFGEWVFAHHIKDLSVLFLRYSFQEYEQIAEALIYLLENQTLERPFFATITTRKIRIRQL